MHVEINELRQRMSTRTDDDLRGIASNSHGEYTAAATDAAREELAEREASGRHIVEEAAEPVADEPRVTAGFPGNRPLAVRAFLWLSVGHLAVSALMVALGMVLVGLGYLTGWGFLKGL